MDEGKRAIPDVNVEKVFHKSGSWEHEYWKQKVGEHYRRQGYEVTFEYKIGDGKSVDLVAEKDGKRIAVEIETGKSDALYNVRKNLHAGFDEIIVVALNEKSREMMNAEFGKLDLGVRVLVTGKSAFF
jgi:predicted RecB family endonuclease